VNDIQPIDRGAFTLPIELVDGISMDAEGGRELGKRYSEAYRSAFPYPHIVADGFLPTEVIRRVLEDFPAKRMSSDAYFEQTLLGGSKRRVHPGDCHEFSKEIFAFFNSYEFLQFLEALTGISGLIPDPYFEGGGYHESFRGGSLAIHADFRIHGKLHLQRRLNVLIYLNDVWDPEWGGNLEIWDKSVTTRVKSIEPVLNRCVIFNTDADSYHGHPDPLACPETHSRRSIALYYYTASKSIYDEIPNHSTMSRARPSDSREVKSAVFQWRLRQHLHDLLPPILFRAYRSLRGMMRRGAS
jgi:2-oxoglutarate-Fe(II)-dependent oxygenase superfamily protein